MKVSIEIAQENLEDLIEKVLVGEEVLIYLDKERLVRLEPIEVYPEENNSRI